MPKHHTRTPAVVSMVAVVAAMAGIGPDATAQSPTAGTPRISANVPLGDPAPAQGRDVPGLATDPADPAHVVEIDEDFLRGECTFRTTFDGGRTWTGGDLTVAGGPTVADPAATDNPVVAKPPPPPCDASDSGGFAHFGQSVAFGTGQNVYTTFSSANSVYVARSADGGRSWAPATVAVGAPPGSRPFDVRPQLAVQADPAGDRIYVSAPGLAVGGTEWQGRRRLVITRSDDGGATWSPVIDVQGEGDDVREPAQPAVAPDGSVYLAWRNGTGPGAGDIVVARSVDRGATWTRNRAGAAVSPDRPVAAGPTQVAPADQAAGDSPDGGFPHLAVDARTGTVHLVYRGAHGGGTDISYTGSSDGGSTWSAPVPVSDDVPRADTRHFLPRLSVPPDGRIDVVWMDTRNSYRSPVAYGDIWYSSSADDGRTFTANRRVNDHSLNLGPGAVAQRFAAPVLTPLGDGRLLFAWGDSRNADTGTGVDPDPHAGSDIYMATMDLAATGPVPASAIPDAAPEKLSVELSRLAFPGGAGRPGSQRTTKVVVVNATDDTGLALSAAVLARASESPLLLARSTDLTSDQKDEVLRLGPGGAYLIGAASRLSDKVVSSLTEAGATDVQRVAGTDATDSARRIALLLDTRDPDARARATPAFDAAVIVNSQTGDAATGSALAAALRLPVLFTQRDVIPPATTEALAALAIRTTLVVGGRESVGDEVVATLPGAKRLGGADPTETSEAVAAEARARNVPTNVVYVTDGERPIDQAALGATVGRVGGLMLAEREASVDGARRSLDKLGLTPMVDRLVVVRSNTEGASPGVRMALAALILLIGIAILLVAMAHRDRDPVEAGPGPERPSKRGGGPERPSKRGGGPERPSKRGGGPERPSTRSRVPGRSG